EVHIGENADKGEQDEKANAEGCTKGWIAQMLAPARQRRRSLACSAERRYSPQIEDDQESSSQIQDGEEVEACRKAEQIGDRGSNEAPNQIAGDNACDIGGQRRRRLFRTATLSQIRHGQSECSSHEHALKDPERRKVQ